MNFLITGGAGSVGRDLTARLLEKGHRVRILDRNPEAPGLDRNAEFIQGEVENPRCVQEALHGADTVVHLAWSFSDDPAELLTTDLKRAAYALAAKERARCRVQRL